MQVTLTPNPKQVEFFKARERFIAYGGARGGGKSWAIRQKAKLLALYYPGIRILILRRSLTELRENHILPLKTDLNSLAQWRESDKAFTFPNTSRILFGYCANENDLSQYQGQEYDVIFMDEATQFTEYQFFALTASLRGANPFPKRMYLTCNPGGVGHGWVKRLFIDRDFKASENPADYRFIQAKASDNPALVEQDKGYLAMLDNLPEDLRLAWRDGRWDVFAGRYFPEFSRQTHVVSPCVLPSRWPRYRVFDYGLDMLACYWCAIDDSGRIWVYRELCQSGLIVSEAARAIRQATLPHEGIRCTVAPPDMWGTQKDTGRTMGELFALNGVPLVTASNRRVQGWMAMKEFLKLRADGRPGMLIFSDCVELIRDLEIIQHDEHQTNDVAKEPHRYTHSPDAMRYLCAWRMTRAQEEEDQEDREGMDYQKFMCGG